MSSLQLNAQQLQVLCDQMVKSPNGINTLLSTTLNSLMKAEREMFLEEANTKGNKANGYRALKGLGIGDTLALSIPRDRLGLFKPLLLHIMKEQSETLNELCFELYANGLTTRQIERITSSIYGKTLSKSQVSRITESFYEEMTAYRERWLSSYYPVVYLDATYVKTRRESVSSEAYYVALGLKEDMTREVIGIYNAPTESAYIWEDIFNDLKARGLEDVGLMVIDDLPGLDQSIEKHFSCNVQKCVLHLKRNILRKVKKTHRTSIAEDLAQIFAVGTTDTKEQLMQRALKLQHKWAKYYPHLKNFGDEQRLRYYATYLQYDAKIQSMIYTTNWIERLNKSFKRTLKIRNSMPSVDSVLTLMSKIALEMEQTSYSYPLTRFKHSNLFN